MEIYRRAHSVSYGEFERTFFYFLKEIIQQCLKAGTHDGPFVCNSVLQTKVSRCVRPRNMFQEIFGVS